MNIKIDFYKNDNIVFGKTEIRGNDDFREYLDRLNNSRESYINYYDFDERIIIENYNYITLNKLAIYFHLNLTSGNPYTARNMISFMGFISKDCSGRPTYFASKQYELDSCEDIIQVFDDMLELEKLTNL